MEKTRATLYTVAHCAATVRWLVNQISLTKESYYPRLSSRIFMAFLAEGVLDTIGRELDKDWSKKDTLGREIGVAKKTIPEKHKIIRHRLLGLQNRGSEYTTYRILLENLKSFRDDFAHPKIIDVETNIHLDEKGNHHFDPVEWEKQMIEHNESQLYDDLRHYLQRLLDKAHDILIDADRDLSYLEKYPHLSDPYGTALKMKGLLYITATYF